eukprot:IDg23463t1
MTSLVRGVLADRNVCEDKQSPILRKRTVTEMLSTTSCICGSNAEDKAHAETQVHNSIGTGIARVEASRTEGATALQHEDELNANGNCISVDHPR